MAGDDLLMPMLTEVERVKGEEVHLGDLEVEMGDGSRMILGSLMDQREVGRRGI
jgi:hypothetical protein